MLLVHQRMDYLVFASYMNCKSTRMPINIYIGYVACPSAHGLPTICVIVYICSSCSLVPFVFATLPRHKAIILVRDGVAGQARMPRRMMPSTGTKSATCRTGAMELNDCKAECLMTIALRCRRKAKFSRRSFGTHGKNFRTAAMKLNDRKAINEVTTELRCRRKAGLRRRRLESSDKNSGLSDATIDAMP